MDVSKLVSMLTNTSVVCSRKLSNRAIKIQPDLQKINKSNKNGIASFLSLLSFTRPFIANKTCVYIDENFSLIQKMFYWIAEKFQKNSFESIIDGKLASYGNQFSCKL